METVFNIFKNKKWTGLVITAVIVILAAGFFFTQPGAADVVQPVKVVSLNLAETVDASGSLEAQPYASLTWKTTGVVESVNVKSGAKVKKGDVLLNLQPDSTSANAASAKADLISAQQNLEDVTNSDSDLAQAVIDLRDAQKEFDDKTGYLHYLQTNKRVPLTESHGWFEKTKFGGWTYVSKTRYYRGPATKDMLIEAENNLELARSQLENMQRKVDRLTNKELDIRSAQAKVDAAQATVNSLSIIAPFDGEVLSVEHRIGDVVSAGELSVNIADMDHLYVETQVDESDIAKVKMGNQTAITLDAISSITFTGKVTAINPVGEVISGLVKYTVRVDLDKVKNGTFLPLGTTSNVTIQTKAASAMLAVPIAAIQNDSDGEFVWVIQSDGTTTRVDVVSGSIIGNLVAVTGNLQEGEQLQLVKDAGFEAPNPLKGGNTK